MIAPDAALARVEASQDRQTGKPWPLRRDLRSTNSADGGRASLQGRFNPGRATLSVQTLFGEAMPIPLDHPSLVSGFHPVEGTGDGRWRWTDSDARIDPALLVPNKGVRVLRMSGRFNTTAPQQTPIAKAA